VSVYGVTGVRGGGVLASAGEFPPVQVSFKWTPTGSNAFEWYGVSGGQFKIEYNDGTNDSMTSFLPLGSNPTNPTFYRVTFPSRVALNVTLYLSSQCFAGVNIAAGDSVSAQTLPIQKLIAVIGDSLGTGYTPYPLSQWLGGWPQQLAELDPNKHTFADAESGTGILSGNSTGGTNYIHRTNDIAAVHANFILVENSINDRGQDTNSLYMAETNLLLSLKTQNPSALIAAIGNYYNGAAPDSTDKGNDMVLSAAASYCGVPYFSLVIANTLNSADYATFFPPGSDYTHPSFTGYTYIARNIRDWLQGLWGANWTATISSQTTANVEFP
jgi:lysophospholipase L1-like esterase